MLCLYKKNKKKESIIFKRVEKSTYLKKIKFINHEKIIKNSLN